MEKALRFLMNKANDGLFSLLVGIAPVHLEKFFILHRGLLVFLLF